MKTERESILRKFGKKLQKVREKNGFTQMGLAIEIESTPGYVSRLENGKIEPGLVTVLAIREALGCEWSDLLQ